MNKGKYKSFHYLRGKALLFNFSLSIHIEKIHSIMRLVELVDVPVATTQLNTFARTEPLAEACISFLRLHTFILTPTVMHIFLTLFYV